MPPLPTVGNAQPVKGKAPKSKRIKNRIYTQQDSLFLKLPAEIRNRIYEAFFTSSTYAHVRKLFKQDPDVMLRSVRFMTWDFMLEMNQTVDVKRFFEQRLRKDGLVELIVRGYDLGSKSMVWLRRGRI